eukprot:11199697-Ditylum_brightwellii.AAC.1
MEGNLVPSALHSNDRMDVTQSSYRDSGLIAQKRILFPDHHHDRAPHRSDLTLATGNRNCPRVPLFHMANRVYM